MAKQIVLLIFKNLEFGRVTYSKKVLGNLEGHQQLAEVLNNINPLIHYTITNV